MALAESVRVRERYQTDPEFRERRLRYAANNREKRREANRVYANKRYHADPHQARLSKYGLTKEDFSAILGEQMGCCKGCGRSLSLTFHRNDSCCIDHDHAKIKGDKGFVRGLLCGGCNAALGHIEDRPETLRRLANYLEAA